MRILMMTNTYAPIMGGLEKSIESFTLELRRRRHKVHIVVPEYEGAPENEKGIVRLPAVQHFNGTDFSVNLPVPGILTDLADVFKPEIIHAHHPFLVGDLALRMAGQYHIPLVFSYHTMFEQYTHYLPLDNEASKAFITELAAGFANLADQVIAPSGSVRDVLLKRGVETPIDIVPTGVSRKFEQGDGRKARQRFKIPSDAFVVGHVGRLAPEKNPQFLCEAVALFLKKREKSVFLVVGDGPSRTEMEDFFRGAGLSDRVFFPGAQEGKRLFDAYHAIDLFAFASLSETQGLVLTEAMAAGVPVVALDGPGVRDVLKDMENGRLLPEQDAADFAAALDWYLGLSVSEKKNLIACSRKTAEEFSVERMTDRLLEVYRTAALRNLRHRGDQDSPWHIMMGRVKTEWEMLTNLGKAAKAAVAEAIKT